MTSIQPVGTTSYTGRNSGDRHVAEGATAVGGTAAGVSAAKNIKRFRQFGLGNAVDSTINTVKTASQPIKQVKSVWGKFGKNCKNFADDIVRWGSKFHNNKFIGPLMKSKMFRGVASGIGSVTAVLVLISGLNNIASVTGDAFRKDYELA